MLAPFARRNSKATLGATWPAADPAHSPGSPRRQAKQSAQARLTLVLCGVARVRPDAVLPRESAEVPAGGGGCQRRRRWQNEPEGDFDSGYVAPRRCCSSERNGALGFQSPIGRERSSDGNQDGDDVRLGPRPVRDPGRSGLSAVDSPPGWLDPAARYLRAELPRPKPGRGGQDAEEAWPQARVHTTADSTPRKRRRR